jgi:hypothetical protein
MITLEKPPDEHVFGPPDGPRQGPALDYAGPRVTCPDCGSSWRGLSRTICWHCGHERVSA